MVGEAKRQMSLRGPVKGRSNPCPLVMRGEYGLLRFGSQRQSICHSEPFRRRAPRCIGAVVPHRGDSLQNDRLANDRLAAEKRVYNRCCWREEPG